MRFDGRSFLRGIGRALDIGATITPTYVPRTPWRRPDAAAVSADWQAVWSDLGIAYARVRQRDGGSSR
jgi:hypothetical protein